MADNLNKISQIYKLLRSPEIGSLVQVRANARGLLMVHAEPRYGPLQTVSVSR